MPLPARTQSVRSNTLDSKIAVPRSIRPTTTSQVSKTKLSEPLTKAKVERQKLDAESSTVPTGDSMTGSQVSSRIPSPLKRNASDQSSRNLQVKPAPNKPTDKGHVRQRSAITPLLSAPKRYTHSRSVSAVSANTITSTSSNDGQRSTHRSGADISSHRPTVPRPKLNVASPGTQPLTVTTRPSSIHAQTELVQNELLQLAAVYKQSSRTMQTYQQSIDSFLAKKQAEISSKRAVVQARKQAFCAALNLLGLDSWLSIEGSQKTCQSLQNLSVAVRDLRNLESIFEGSDGLAAAFVDWQECMCIRDTGDTTLPSDFITLHTVFKDRLAPDIRRFKQQVSSTLASLANLPDFPPDTSLASVVQGHTSLAVSLTSQCQVMLQIGDILVANHLEWLQGEVRAAILHERKSVHSGRHSPHSVPDPIWDL